MKKTIILASYKATCERLRLLINTVFPEEDVSCVSDGLGAPEKDPPPLHPNWSGLLIGSDSRGS